MRISLKSLKINVIHIVGIILFRLLLDFNYSGIIVSKFWSGGFLNQSTTFSSVISWFALLILIPFIISMYKTPKISSNIIVLLFLSSFVPMTSLMRFMPMGFEFFVLFMIYWFLILSLYFAVPNLRLSQKEVRGNSFFLWILLFVFASSVLFVSGYYFKFRIHLSMMDVYDLRDEERALNLPTILKYLLPAAGNILPVLLVYFLFVKKKLIALAIGFIILLDFSIGGHKAVLVKLFLCFLGYWFYNEKRVVLFSWVLSFISLFSLVEMKVYGTCLIANIGIRRVFYLPAKLNYYYYEYFSIHEPDYFRQGVLRWFGVSSSYKDPIPKIIGSYFYNNSDTNCNNGLFSDAYYNFNALGIFIFPIILIIIFKFFDSVSKGIDSKLWIMPIVVALTFKSGAFTSVLLTNGVILLLITLYCMPRIQKSSIHNS